MGEELDKWLMESDHNLEIWTQGKVPAWQRRVMMTNFLSNTWKKIWNGYNDDLNEFAPFDIEKVGSRAILLMTIDGSLDDQIHPQGYKSIHNFEDTDAGNHGNTSEIDKDGDD